MQVDIVCFHEVLQVPEQLFLDVATNRRITAKDHPDQFAHNVFQKFLVLCLFPIGQPYRLDSVIEG